VNKKPSRLTLPGPLSPANTKPPCKHPFSLYPLIPLRTPTSCPSPGGDPITPMEAGSLFRFAAASGRFTACEAKLTASQTSFLCNSYSHHCTWFPFFQTYSQKRAFLRPIGKRCFGTDSTGDLFSTSKRRSRGPVMAAKKAAEGNAYVLFELIAQVSYEGLTFRQKKTIVQYQLSFSVRIVGPFKIQKIQALCFSLYKKLHFYIFNF
jgi:hypothetical protein